MRSIIIILIILITTLVTNIGIAQEKKIAAETINHSKIQASTIVLKSVCLEGFLFAVVVSGEGYGKLRGVSITQIYTTGERFVSSPPQPKRCK